MNKGTILLIEDNPDDVELTLRALKKNNVPNEVVVAADGIEAIDYLFGTGGFEGRDTRIQPILVLLDLKLPRMDGLEVLERLRADERTRMVTVIVLTSSRQDEDILESYRLGASSYVRKPVDFAEFTEAMGKIVGYWLALNEPPPLENKSLKMTLN